MISQVHDLFTQSIEPLFEAKESIWLVYRQRLVMTREKVVSRVLAPESVPTVLNAALSLRFNVLTQSSVLVCASSRQQYSQLVDHTGAESIFDSASRNVVRMTRMCAFFGARWRHS